MINYKFIEKLEGNKLNGYVPDSKNSNSGGTIAMGFDIGQRKTSDLIDLFGYSSLTTKLACYTDKKGQIAVKHLRDYPLTITKEERETINSVVRMSSYLKLIKLWSSATKNKFTSLSVNRQTVIASVAFQYGNLATETPNFWQQVTTGDWDAALANLRDFEDKYPTRRNKEADLLEGKS